MPRRYRRHLLLNSVCLPGHAMLWLFKPWSYGFPAAARAAE